jgi:hypothetical protein
MDSDYVCMCALYCPLYACSIYVFLESEDGVVQQQQQQQQEQQQRSSNREQQQRPWPLPLPLEQTASTGDSGTAAENAPAGKTNRFTHILHTYKVLCSLHYNV